MPSLEIFVKNVRNLMAQREIRLKDLAEKIGISEPYLSLVLNGTKTNLSDEYKDKIASFFNVSMADLYTDDIEESPSQEHVLPENPERYELRKCVESFIQVANLEDLRLPFLTTLLTLDDASATVVKTFFTRLLKEISSVSKTGVAPSLPLLPLTQMERTILLVSSMAAPGPRLTWVQSAVSAEQDEFNRIVMDLQQKGYISVVEDSCGVKRIKTSTDFTQSASLFFTQDKLRDLHLCLSSAMENQPDEGPFFYFNLARHQNLAGLSQKAISNLEKAASLFQSSGLWTEAARAWVELGFSYGLLGEAFEKAKCLFRAAQCCSKSEDLDSGDELGAQCISIFRQLGQGEMVGNTCLMLGNNWIVKDKNKAIQWYEIGVKNTPESSLVYGRLLVNLGSCYLDTGKTERAELVMNKASKWIKEHESNDVLELKSHIHLISGLIQYKRRNWTYARRLFLSCLESSTPDSLEDIAVAHHNLGMIAYREDNPSESIQHLKKALEIYNQLNMPAYWAYGAVELAKSYLRSGQVDLARGLIVECSSEEVKRFLENSGWFYLVKSAVAWSDLNQKEALENGKMSVEVFSRDGASQRDLACASMWLSQILGAQGRLQAAKPYETRALKIYEKKNWDIKELNRDVSLLRPRSRD